MTSRNAKHVHKVLPQDLQARISTLASWPPSIVHPAASVDAFSSYFRSRATQAAREAPSVPPPNKRKPGTASFSTDFSDTLPSPPPYLLQSLQSSGWSSIGSGLKD